MTINRGYRLTVIGKSDMSFWQSASLPREAALLAKADWPWLNNSLDTVLPFFFHALLRVLLKPPSVIGKPAFSACFGKQAIHLN